MIGKQLCGMISMNWQEIVENMMTMGEENRSDIWAAWYNQNDPAALEYCIATYLMGKVNGCTSVVFHPQPTYDGGYPYNLAGYSLDTVRQEINNHPEFFNLQMGDAPRTNGVNEWDWWAILGKKFHEWHRVSQSVPCICSRI